jgi:hypothetical protein
LTGFGLLTHFIEQFSIKNTFFIKQTTIKQKLSGFAPLREAKQKTFG